VARFGVVFLLRVITDVRDCVRRSVSLVACRATISRGPRSAAAEQTSHACIPWLDADAVRCVCVCVCVLLVSSPDQSTPILATQPRAYRSVAPAALRKLLPDRFSRKVACLISRLSCIGCVCLCFYDVVWWKKACVIGSLRNFRSYYSTKHYRIVRSMSVTRQRDENVVWTVCGNLMRYCWTNTHTTLFTFQGRTSILYSSLFTNEW